MGLAAVVRRRFLLKIHPVFKRVVFPIIFVVFLVQFLVSGGPKPQQRSLPDVLPGEALDPLVQRPVRHVDDHRPEEPFETVINAAIEVDEEQSKQDLEHERRTPEVNKKNKQTDKKLQEKKEMETVEKKEMKMETYLKEKEKEDDSKHSEEWSMNKLNIPGKDQVAFEGHKVTERTVTLTIMSSADKVFMSLNKREIYRGLEDRGMHIVVLHPHTGTVMASRVFDTFLNGTEVDMIEFLDGLQDGRIVVFAVRDDAASSLTWRGRNKLKSFGARFADQLAFRDMWILVTRKGGLKLAESYSNVAIEDTNYEWGGPLFLRTDFDLTELSDVCKFEGQDNERRKQFCQRYEGYGDLCKCTVKRMQDVFFTADKKGVEGIVGSDMYDDLAVAVLAHGNPNYLYKTLKSLREAPGFNPSRVVVYVDVDHREIKELSKLFGLKVVVTGTRTASNVTAPTRIKDNIQFILRDTLGTTFPADKFPPGINELPPVSTLSAQHLVLIEEDIRVSIDFFKYLHALAPILTKDPTVLAVAAFNYNSYVFVADSPSNFYRTDMPQHLALMFNADTVKKHIAPRWPSVHSNKEWYTALTSAMAGAELDMIVPEVSRTKHTGFNGHKISGSAQYTFFHDHKIVLTTDYKIPQENINRLEKMAYQTWRTDTLKKAKPVSLDFCTLDLDYGRDRLVVYANYDGTYKNDQQLLATMKCLGAWHVYAEGGWKNTWEFTYHGHPLTVVGVPASTYSYLKPQNYNMVDMTKVKKSTPH